MKRLLKKMSAFLLTGAMVTGMCFTSLATSTKAGGSTEKVVTSGATANIQVGVSSPEDEAANGGDTLLAYRVVDIEYDEDTNNLTYSFTDIFKAFLGDSLGSGWSGLDEEGYGSLSEDELKPLLGNFAAYVKGLDSPPAADYTKVANADGVAFFEGVAMGQYIILGDGNSKGARIYQTVTAEVVPEIKNGVYVIYSDYVVSMKTSTPSVEKDITEGTVIDESITTGNQGTGDKHEAHQQTSNIGKEITYTLKVSVPAYPEGATNKTFYVGDTLSKGLDYVADSIAVKGIAGTESSDLTADAYTFSALKESEGGTTALYIDFDFDKIAAYDSLEIVYKAKLNSDAVIGTIAGNPNNVDLIYSNSPFDGKTWEPDDGDRPGDKPGYGKDEDMEIVYTYALVIDKFEEKHEDEKLSGAEFEIYPNAELSGDPIATITTDANGAAMYAGLEKGTYYLKETVAPTGYNLMTDAIEIVIDGSKIPYYAESEKSVTHYTYTTTAGAEQAKINGDYVWMNKDGEVRTTAENTAPEGYSAAYVASEETTVEHVILIDRKGLTGEGAANGFYKAGVANHKAGGQLPSTGGIGTAIFTAVGLLLMIGTAVVMITRRRMSVKKK